MKQESGFTLLEALFSMAIFAVAMLGLIGMQINAIQSDEETRRKDMASQLLTAGAELVACTDYASFDAGKELGDLGFDGLVRKAEARDGQYAWMDSGGGKTELYQGHKVTSVDDVTYRNVYLVAAWDSIKSGKRETLHRMMVKPQNILQ